MLSVAGLCEPTSGEIMRESVYGAEKVVVGQWLSCCPGHVDRMAGVATREPLRLCSAQPSNPLGITQPCAKSSTRRHQVTMSDETLKRLGCAVGEE
jgi:hypothetical protein